MFFDDAKKCLIDFIIIPIVSSKNFLNPKIKIVVLWIIWEILTTKLFLDMTNLNGLKKKAFPYLSNYFPAIIFPIIYQVQRKSLASIKNFACFRSVSKILFRKNRVPKSVGNINLTTFNVLKRLLLFVSRKINNKNWKNHKGLWKQQSRL